MKICKKSEPKTQGTGGHGSGLSDVRSKVYLFTGCVDFRTRIGDRLYERLCWSISSFTVNVQSLCSLRT